MRKFKFTEVEKMEELFMEAIVEAEETKVEESEHHQILLFKDFNIKIEKLDATIHFATYQQKDENDGLFYDDYQFYTIYDNGKEYRGTENLKQTISSYLQKKELYEEINNLIFTI